MAKVEFNVLATVDPNSEANLQRQLNRMRLTANVTIDNQQALQSIKAVQQQVNALKQSLSGLKLNIGGNTNIGQGGSGGGTSNGSGIKAQFEATTLQKTESLYRQISNTVNGTVKNIQVLRNEQGQIVSGVVTISDGFKTWKRNLEFVDGQFQRIIASGRDNISLSQKSNDLYKQREQHLKNISNIKKQLLTATGDEKRVLEQQLQSEQRLSKLVANKISRQTNGVAMNQTSEGEARISQLKTQLAYEEKLAQAKLRVKQATIEQNSLNRLGTETGSTLNTKSIKDIASLKSALSTTNIGWNNNTHSIKQFSQQVDSAGKTVTKFTVRHKTIENGVEVWKDTSYAVSSADGKLRQYNQTQQQVLNTQQSLTTMLKSAIERFAVWGIAMKAWTTLGNGINDCVSYIKDLDKAMTDIRIVTMDTQEATEKLFETYNRMGQELGRSTLDVAESADTWLRQGYAQQETNALIKDSMMLSTLGQIDSAEATTALTSAMKGYQLSVEEVTGVVDKFVAVDLVAATSAGDLATALSRTANMARTNGIELEKMIAILATTQEVTQGSAETVGNTWKTILSRMGNIKLGKLEDPESGEALNDVETSLNAIGIKLREGTNDWRDFGDVLDEVGQKWQNGEFSETEKSALATAFAGTRQKENFLVLMENYQNVEKYATEAFESAGLAEEKYGIYTDSIAGKQETLTAKFQEFYSTVLDSDFLKGLFDIANSFMTAMNWADGLLGKIVLLTTAFIGLNVVLKTLKTTALVTNFISLFNTIKSVIVGVKTMNVAFLTAGESGISALLLSIPKLIAGLISLIAQEGFATVATMGLNGVLQALNINPVMLGISALIAVVAGGIAIFNAFNVTLEEQHEKAQQAQADYQEVANELRTVNGELATTKQRIAELEAEKSLTFVEKEELKKLKETNSELESQVYWLQKAKNLKMEEVDTEASKAWDKDFNITDKESRYKKTSHHDGSTSATKITEKEYIDEQIQYLNELEAQIQEVSNAEGEWANKTMEQRETELERLRGLKTGVEEYLTEVGARIQTDFLDSYDVSDDVKKSWLELQDIIRVALDPDYSVEKFKEAVDDLPDRLKTNFKEADNAGNFKNLEEAFTVGENIDSTNLEKFKEALKAIGIEADDPSVLNYLNALSEATANISVTPLQSYSDIINSVKDKAEALADAEIELAESNYLTSDTVVELEKQFGDLSEYLTLTANGYSISKAGLDALNGSMLSQYQTALNEAKTGALNVLDQEHKKGLSYASTTEEIKKQLEAQLALARAKQGQVLAEAKSKGYTQNEAVVRSDKYGTEYRKYADEEQAIQDAIDSIENAQKNYDVAKETLNTIINETTTKASNSSKSQKEWWETALESLKDDLDYNVITMDTYINGIQNILAKLKKGSDAWQEVNAELQKAKLDNLENQFDRGEITIDQYIKKLEELRKSYKKNTEGYKELTDTINDTKYDKFASQYERGEITADKYIGKLKSLQKQYKEGSEEYKKLADEIDEIKLEKTEKYLDKLESRLDKFDQKMDELGEVNTNKESVKYAELLSKKYTQIQKDISSIRKQLKDTNLTEKQREALQERLNDLLVEEVDIRDEIEDQVREYYENQKEQAEQQAELNRKEILYQKELELYGQKGKELVEWETNQKIKAIEEQIELREAEKEALDEINEREQLENDLLEAKLKLQNALNNKTTKILKKQADGTWQFEYSANMADVKSAKEEIANAEKALADFDWEQGIQALQDEADRLADELEDLNDKYEEAEFWADREYEQTMNGIDKAYGDIDTLVEKWMKTYGGDITKLTEGYQSVVSANNTLEDAIVKLTSALESSYETIGVNSVSSVDGVKSIGTSGSIIGNGLTLAYNKEQALRMVDVTKFGGYIGNKAVGSRVNASSAGSTIIHNVNCTFPNITSTDGLQQAILQLPRLALQSK